MRENNKDIFTDLIIEPGMNSNIIPGIEEPSTTKKQIFKEHEDTRFKVMMKGFLGHQ